MDRKILEVNFLEDLSLNSVRHEDLTVCFYLCSIRRQFFLFYNYIGTLSIFTVEPIAL